MISLYDNLPMKLTFVFLLINYFFLARNGVNQEILNQVQNDSFLLRIPSLFSLFNVVTSNALHISCLGLSVTTKNELSS